MRRPKNCTIYNGRIGRESLIGKAGSEIWRNFRQSPILALKHSLGFLTLSTFKAITKTTRSMPKTQMSAAIGFDKACWLGKIAAGCLLTSLILLILSGCSATRQKMTEEGADEIYQNLFVPSDAIGLCSWL